MDSVILSDKSNIPSTVRIVLFKECRLKERQLLFDSSMSSNGTEFEMSKWLFSAIPCNRFSEEYNQMSELIFGSTAMRFHGTYYKIHEKQSVQKLLFTQVFPTPCRRRLNKSKVNIKMSKSFLGSYNSEFEDPLFEKRDSISSESSISIFRKSESDRTNTVSTIDSGFTEQSLVSIPTTDSEFSISTANGSSDVLLKKYSRLSSYQSEGSESAITPSSSSQSYAKSKSSYSRIGLAIVITLPEKQDVYPQFYMYYAYFIENILCRIRQSTDIAINSMNHFLSVINNITKEANNFIDDLLKYTFYKSDQNANSETHYMGTSSNFNFIKKILYNKLFNITKLSNVLLGRNLEDETFKSWCRLLETINTKEKNFFLSSLLTAVLTIHHGWISTCYKMISVKENVSLRNSYNALWYQLLEYYGSFGPHRQISKIVLQSSFNRNDVIKGVIQLLRYFIRYFRVQRREIERVHIKDDNEKVNLILTNERRRKSSVGTNKLGCFISNKEKFTLSRTKTFNANLVQMASLEDCSDSDSDPVIFILGDNEKLINLGENDNTETEDNDEEWINFSNQSPMTQMSQSDPSGEDKQTKMKVISFPLPRESVSKTFVDMDPYEFTLDKQSFGKLAPDYILQSNISSNKQWKENLKSEFLSQTCSYSTESNTEEVVAVLGEIDDWKVQIISSKRSINSSLASDAVDTSQLVADLLEVTEEMRKNCIPKQFCLTHIEQRLFEICLRANALANLLITTDICTMDYLLSTLQIDINDVPLLMSIASTLYPEITKKYGISYQ